MTIIVKIAIKRPENVSTKLITNISTIQSLTNYYFTYMHEMKNLNLNSTTAQ